MSVHPVTIPSDEAKVTPMPIPENISQDDKEIVPFKEKLAYGAGAVTNQFGEGGINSIATPVYNITMGLNPSTIGFVLGAIRLWDAVTDPIMGRISDNWKGESGRRKPFMFWGAILMAITYPLVWFCSPNWTDNAKTIYFFSLAIIFFTSYTIFSVPFRALGTELTPDTSERTSISVISAFCTNAFYLIVPWVFPISQSEFFDDPVLGIRVITGLSSIMILITGIVASRVPLERYKKVADKQEDVKLLASFKSFLTDRCFLTLHGMGLGLLCSIMMVDALGLYINLYYVWDGDIKWGSSVAAMGANITQALGFIILFIIKKWLMKIEKKTLIKISLMFAITGSIAKWFLFDPAHPYLPLAMPFFFAPAYTGLWAIFMSMLGDFCDYDEHENGKRREGMFGSVSGWVMKAGGSAAVAMSGVILTMTGFDKELGGDQADQTFLLMRLLFIGLPFCFFLITFAMNIIYPLDGARMKSIRKDLEERRGTIG